MEFKDKKWLVLGVGVSGIGAACFLRKRGAVVGLFDDRKYEGIPEAIYVNQEQAESENFDYCVISPGVSIRHPIAQNFTGERYRNNTNANIHRPRIVSELALGFTAPHKKIVAITGTNGKTSVTKMIGAAVGKRGVVCGNIGLPVTQVSAEISKKIAITEVSSFMMEADATSFAPDVSIILNITQDHLERHETMEEYIKCKAKLTRAGTVILNYDCLNCRILNDGRAIYFSTVAKVRGIYLEGKNVVLNIGKRPKVIFRLDEFCEDRPHQISNILAVILACIKLRVPRKRILAACRVGKINENRIQHVGEVGNIAFVNDSKATNIAASLAACACFQVPINLLIGGLIKGQNFNEFFAKLPKHVEHVFAFGAGADEIFTAAERENFNDISKYKSMREAAVAAFKHGFGPKIVLLSPACSSFDEFANYAARGKAFEELVKEIANDKS